MPSFLALPLKAITFKPLTSTLLLNAENKKVMLQFYALFLRFNVKNATATITGAETTRTKTSNGVFGVGTGGLTEF